MTDEIDLMKKTLLEYDKAVRVKKMNDELFDHLLGSVIWILKYAEKYSIPLPKKDELYRMVKRSEFLIDEILYANNPSDETLQGGNATHNRRELDGTGFRKIY
jgi:hypothetical protein